MGRKNRDFVNVTYSIKDNGVVNIIDTSISTDNDTSISEEKLEALLKKNIEGKPNLTLGILIAINEAVDNILEHSDGSAFNQFDRTVKKPGIISIEYCNNISQVIVTIWDFGKGIVDTLSEEYDELTREDVLLNAFELNVTRHRKKFKNRGNGLSKLKEFVLASNGSIFCETNEFEIVFSSVYPNGYIRKTLKNTKGTHFEIKVGCSDEINIYPIFDTDAFEEFFDFEKDSIVININDYAHLNSHQIGIKIKKIILENIVSHKKFIILDFDGVEIFTDSFIQQITTILSEEIGFESFAERIKFTNLNKKILESMVQEKIYIASLNK